MMSSINISIDTREPKKVYKELEKFTELKIEYKALNVCDIIIWGKPTWFIERKTISDFINTALSKDNRLKKQLEMLANLQNGDKKSALLLSGDVNRTLKYRKMNKLSYTDLTNSIPIIWGIPILPVNWDWQVPYLLRYIAHQVGQLDAPHEYPLRSAVSSELSLDEQVEYILQGIPGVGVQTSKKLLKKYKTISDIVQNACISGYDVLNSHIKNSTTTETLIKLVNHKYGEKDE